MARLRIEDRSSENEALYNRPTQSSRPLPHVLARGESNVEDEEAEVSSSSDGQSEIPAKRLGSKMQKKETTALDDAASNKGNPSKFGLGQGDQEEEDAEFMARTINAGLSVNETPGATKQPENRIWNQIVKGVKGVSERLWVGSPKVTEQAPESNISRKRTADVSEQTSANTIAPDADEEVPVRGQVIVTPQRLPRPSHTHWQLDRPKTGLGKGRPNPYDELDEESPVSSTAGASRPTARRGQKFKALQPRRKPLPEQKTSSDIARRNGQTPHEASNAAGRMAREIEEEDDGRLSRSPPTERSSRVDDVTNAAAPTKIFKKSNKSQKTLVPTDFPRRYEKGDILSSSFEKQPSVDLGESSIRNDISHARYFLEDTIDRVDGILMSSSPINMRRSEIGAKRYRQGNNDISEHVASYSEDTREAPENDRQRDSNDSPYVVEKVLAVPEVQEELDSIDTTPALLDYKILKKMLELMERVGTVKVGASYKRVATSKNVVSPHGRSIIRTTRRITSICGKIKDYEDSEEYNREAVDKQHNIVLVLIKTLESQTSEILTDRLGDSSSGTFNNVDAERRFNILHDLYLYIFPELVKTLNAAVSVYQKHGQISTPHLKEVSKILKAMSDLLAAAAEEKRQLTRKEYGSTVKPMQSLYCYVRDLSMVCRAELEARATEMQAIAYKQAAPERKRKREERELAEKRAEVEAHQELLRRHHREAGISWEERKQRGMVPSSSQIIEISLASQQWRLPSGNPAFGSRSVNGSQLSIAERLEAKYQEAAVLESKLHRVKQETRKLKRAEERSRREPVGDGLSADGDSLHDDDYDEERLHMFGESNTATSTSTPWARIELETLVDGLRQQRGRDRYEIIATRLDRSYDEIFAKAREFRLTMEENLERKRQENPWQNFQPLEDWIDCIGMEF